MVIAYEKTENMRQEGEDRVFRIFQRPHFKGLQPEDQPYLTEVCREERGFGWIGKEPGQILLLIQLLTECHVLFLQGIFGVTLNVTAPWESVKNVRLLKQQD